MDLTTILDWLAAEENQTAIWTFLTGCAATLVLRFLGFLKKFVWPRPVDPEKDFNELEYTIWQRFTPGPHWKSYDGSSMRNSDPTEHATAEITYRPKSYLYGEIFAMAIRSNIQQGTYMPWETVHDDKSMYNHPRFLRLLKKRCWKIWQETKEREAIWEKTRQRDNLNAAAGLVRGTNASNG